MEEITKFSYSRHLWRIDKGLQRICAGYRRAKSNPDGSTEVHLKLLATNVKNPIPSNWKRPFEIQIRF